MTTEPLILHAGALGDLVLTLQLALRLPGFANAPSIRVLARQPLPTIGQQPRFHFASLEANAAHQLYVASDETGAWATTVEGRVVLNCLGDPSSVPHRQLVRCGPKQLLSLDPVLRDDTGRHVIDRWAGTLGGQGSLARFCARVTRTALQHVEARDANLLLLHPGSGGVEKCWHGAGFVAVARRWEQGGGRCRVLLGEVELDRWDAADRSEFAPWLTVCETRAALVQELQAGGIFLGNDSGPSHLAAGLGLPTLALFGPTDPATWRPIGPQVAVLRGDTDQPDWGITPEGVLKRLRLFAAPGAQA